MGRVDSRRVAEMSISFTFNVQYANRWTNYIKLLSIFQSLLGCSSDRVYVWIKLFDSFQVVLHDRLDCCFSFFNCIRDLPN